MLFWNRPGLEARQLLRSTLLGTGWATVLRVSLLSLLAQATLPTQERLMMVLMTLL